MSIVQGGRKKGVQVKGTGPQGPQGPQGIPGVSPTPTYGELYIQNNAVATALTVQGTFYQIVAGWVNGLSAGMTPQAGSSNIKCLAAGVYRVVCSVAHSNNATSGKTFEFTIFVNGVQVASVTQHHSSTGNTGFDNLALSGLLNLGVNALVDVRARCTDAPTINLTINDINLSLVKT